MDTDLAVLARRVAQLERVLGAPGAQPGDAGAGALAELRAGERRLAALVPGELVAAHRVVRTLREAVPALGSLGAYRRMRAEGAERVVDDAVHGLREMQALQESIQGAGYRVDEVINAAPHIVRLEGVAAHAVSAVHGEEESVEKLLLAYNDAVASLNCRILRMAAIVRAIEEERGGGNDEMEGVGEDTTS